MTDWWSVWDAEKIIKSGQDLEMPGEKYLKADAERLLKTGKVSEAEIDRMVKSILRTEIAMGLHDRPVKDSYFLGRFGEHEKVALQTGREAVVLLKNTNAHPAAAQGRPPARSCSRASSPRSCRAAAARPTSRATTPSRCSRRSRRPTASGSST